MDKKTIIIIILAGCLLISLFIYSNFYPNVDKIVDSFTIHQEASLSWTEGAYEEKIFQKIDLDICNLKKLDRNLVCFSEEISILPKQINSQATYPRLFVEIKCVCWKK